MTEKNNEKEDLALSIIKEKMVELKEEISELKNEIDDLKEQNENLTNENEKLKEKYDLEKLEQKAKVLDKMKVAISGLHGFFSAYEETYERIIAGEYIKGSDPIRDIIEEIVNKRIEKEKK